MTTYAQPQYSNTYPQQHQQRSTYPPVQPPPPWIRPPYSGPPPIPAGVSVNPQQWQAGFWQINPAFKQNVNQPQQQQQQQQQQQHVPWIPSHHWTNYQPQRSAPQQPQPSSQSSQQASFNPYKRVPKPPSAEYLATELSSNPLGLENMIPVSVEEYYRQGHQTPWIWKPSALADDDSPTSTSNQHRPSDATSSTNSPGRRRSEGEVVREPESYTTKRELQPTFSSKIVRTPEHYRNDSKNTPSPKRSSSYSSMGSIDSQMSQLSMKSSTSTSTSSGPAPLSRHSSMPVTSSTSFSSVYSSSPTRGDYSSVPMLTEQLSDEPDSILSPLILSKTPLLSGGNLRTLRNHPNPLLATQSLDTIPEGSSSSNAMRANSNLPAPRDNYQPHQPSNLQHAKTMPNPPKSDFVYPIVASPPQMHIPPKIPDNKDRQIEHRDSADRTDRDQRERGREWERIGTRHTTYVDPHITSTGAPSPRSRVQPSSRPSSRPSSVHASPVRHSTNVTPPTYPTSPSSSVHTNITSPSNPSRLSNPLPPPPQLVQRQPILPIQRTPPPHWRDKVRRGFWNRRGDFLTADGYIVYAPADKAYPQELETYPEETAGYQDHNLQFTTFIARPELPQSLPKHGQPPECPYEAFVVYEYK